MMRQVVVKRTDATAIVAGGRLNLDHIGAHVSQQSRAKVRSMGSEIEDAESRERAWAGHEGYFLVSGAR